MLNEKSIQQTEMKCLQEDDIHLPTEKTDKSQEKIPLHPLLFLTIVLMMNSIPLTNIFLLFAEPTLLDIKSYSSIAVSVSLITTVMTTALVLKLKFLDFLKTIFIMDSIMLSTALTTAAFIGLMKYLDRDKWEMKIIEVSFAIAVVLSGMILRMLLLYMKWKPWEVILFKLGLFSVALIYFGIGVYCFYTKYSFTFNILQKFDQQCRYFVYLYVFTAFELSFKMVKTMSNFDFTQKLKSSYLIKHVPKNKEQKQAQIHKLKYCCKPSSVAQQSIKRSMHIIPVTKIKSLRNIANLA